MATTITANGINFPDGSAGSPSIGGTDTNTGLFTGSDIVGFATGGSERLRIDASGNVNIANDSGKLRLGTGADLQIYHDGTHSRIKNDTGTLFTLADEVRFKNNANNETLFVATANGAVELYHDNSKKLETTSGGIDLPDQLQVDGTVFATGGLKINSDSTKLRLGASDDLEIYHDGNSSWIKNAAGDLIVNTPNFYVNNAAQTETMISAIQNGGVTLKYDNSTKFETYANGCTVTGNLNAGNVDLADNAKARFGTSNDLEIYHDGTHSMIKDNGTGSIIMASDSYIYWTNAATNETIIKGGANAGVELYYDNSKKLETITDGIQVTDYIKFTGTGCGIDFGTTSNAAGMSSEVLDDYEEGQWAPSVATGTISYSNAYYTKVGRLVTIQAKIQSFSNNSSSSAVEIGNLPFTAAVTDVAVGSVLYSYVSQTNATVLYINSNTTLGIYGGSSGVFDGITHNELNNNSNNTTMFVIATYQTT